MSALSQRPRVAVIGGGITGLAAAWELHRSGSVEITLLESSSRLGGVIETRERGGHTFECGPDSMLRRMPWGVDLCGEVGIADQLVGTSPDSRGVYTVHRGRLVRVPDGLAAMAPSSTWQMLTTPIVSLPGKLRMLRERTIPPRDAKLGDESLADFARRRLGREAFERIVQPLAGGIFMGDPERLSLPACFPQFAAMEAQHGSLTRAAAEQRKSAPPSKGESIFVAPQRGLQQMTHAIGSLLPAASIRLNAAVDMITRVGDGQWQITTADGQQQAYDGVIVATPARVASRLITPVDTRAGELLGAVNSSNCAIVVVAAKRSAVRQPLDASGFVVPHVERRQLAACTFSSTKYAGRAPADEVTFRVFVGGPTTPDACDRSDQDLSRLAVGELQSLVGLTGEPLWVEIVRWPSSMPQYELGHLDRIAELDHRLAQHAGLELAGNAYRGVGIPYCVRSGREAAQRVLAAITAAVVG